jgi:alpha-tubulin suppressor-like RCC1 family protein
MKPLTPPFTALQRLIAAIAILPGVISCSGGGEDAGGQPAPTTAPTTPPAQRLACDQYNAVLPGFSGDLNAPGPIADGGNDGPSGGDAGSAGAGGGLGKVLGAKVEVLRLADGSKFNNADVRTDPVNGLFTIRTCALSEPLLITLKGVEGAQYYDEGRNALLPFGPDQEIHALIASVEGNVGVSALTEAAYRYAINNFLGALPKTAEGPNFLLKKAGAEEVRKLTKAQILAANKMVQDEFNRVLPANYRLDTVTALPTPVGTDNNQNESLFPQNRYGQAAVVTGAFAWMADKFRIGSDRPALAILEEFSRDLTDGKLDGFALDGTVSSSTAVPAYDSVNIPITLNVGANAIADSFSDANLNAAYKYIYVTDFREEQTCDTNAYFVGLTKFGTLEVQKQRVSGCLPSGPRTRDDAFIATAGTHIKEVLNSQYSGGGFFVKEDGRVFSWGNSECGQIANGKGSGIQPLPQAIAGLKNITSLASGYFFSIARDNDGHVYSWGSNGSGALGLGSSPPLNATCFSTVFTASSVPQQVPGLSDIATVHAHEARAFAVTNGGKLYNWGTECGRGGGGATYSSPVLVQNLPAVRSFAANTTGCFALKTDGTLVGWGFYNNVTHGDVTYMDGQWFGDGQDSAKVQPTPLPGLKDVREIASDQFFFYALKTDGTVWRWGSAPGMPILKTPTLIAGIPEAVPGVKTIIRHIQSSSDGARLFAQDGRIFQAKPWEDSPHHLTNLVDIFGLK